MKIIYFITLIFCFHDFMHLNEGLSYYDFQHTKSRDLVKEDITGFYGSDEIYPDDLGKSIPLYLLEALVYILNHVLYKLIF